MLAGLPNDVRYSARGLAKRPLFTVTVVLALAVGIGVSVAMYTIFDGLVLRSISGADAPEQLVNLSAPGLGLKHRPSCDTTGTCEEVFSYPMFRDLERVQEPFVGIAAHRMRDMNLAFRGETSASTGLLVSGSYFELLGVQPALGRLLGPQDDGVEGTADSVVLSYRYWRNALGGEPSVLGETLVVNGKPLTIVGVAPAGFAGTTRPFSPEVFVPITLRWRDAPGVIPNFDDRRHYWAYLFARLKPGVSLAQAETAINGPYRAILSEVEAPLQVGMTAQELAQFRARTIGVAPGAKGQSEAVRIAAAPLAIVLVAAGAVLLIACVNVANLMLARGASRIGEMAVRLSIGAGPRRLVTLLFTESALLALAAALVALPLVLAALRWVQSMVPAPGAAAFDFGLNAGLVGTTTLVALCSTVVFALLPVLKLARVQPGRVLHGGAARATSGRAGHRFRVGLVTAQIALSTMLLVLAGLLAESLANIGRADLGMRLESLLSFSVAPERNGYDAARSAALFDQLERELAGQAGVTSVASSLVTLLAGSSAVVGVRASGFEPAADARPVAHFNGVSAGFLATLDIPLLAGRDFVTADAGRDRPKVAIVNQQFAEFFRLGPNPVGARIGYGEGSALDIEIVGLAADAKYDNVKQAARPQLFVPRGQLERVGEATFYVRSGSDPERVLAGIREVVRRIDPTLPVMDARTVERQVQENVFLDRFIGSLAGALATLATFLAGVGLYGVLSYIVAQRTREMALRMALGSPPQQLRRLVLRQVIVMAAVGGAIGVAAALPLGTAAGALLYGVNVWDPAVLAVAVLVLGAVVLAAGYIPAWRASRIDPMTALRAE